MGILNNLSSVDVADHSIEIECRNSFWVLQYTLVVDGFKQDQIEGLMGRFYLRGWLEVDGIKKPFRVRVKQGLGTKFVIEYDGREIIPIKIY